MNMKAYKYRSGISSGIAIFERDINTMFENKIYAPDKDNLNDPMECLIDDRDLIAKLNSDNKYVDLKKTYLDFKNQIASSGVYSLSHSFSNIMLWSLYSNVHTGFCIEYEIETIKNSLNYNKYVQLSYDIEVNYDEIPVIDLDFFKKINNDRDKMFRIYLGTKIKEWEAEKEIRLILDKFGLYEIDYRAITGIYFGYKMKDDEINFIMEKMKGRGLKYYKMDIGYEVKRIPLEDKFSNAEPYSSKNLNYDINSWWLTKEYMEETYIYKDKLIEALDIVKNEPLIREIYQASITKDAIPIIKIFTTTNSSITPIKIFQFKIDRNREIVKI